MAAVLPLYTPRIAPRSHSCTRVGAATSALPLPSSCAKRPGQPGRFQRYCANKPTALATYAKKASAFSSNWPLSQMLSITGRVQPCVVSS